MSYNAALLPSSDTPTWKVLRSGLDARLSELCKELEQDHPANETAILRGRISELRGLIRAVEDVDPEAEAEPHASVPFI